MPDFIAVIFDFDYTLADSSDGVVECVNYALDALSFTPQPRDDIYRTIGLSLPHTFEALTGVTNPVMQERFAHFFLDRQKFWCIQSLSL